MNSSNNDLLIDKENGSTKSGKSPPPIKMPAEPLVPDTYLFSPGIDTPGHRLEVRSCLEPMTAWHIGMRNTVPACSEKTATVSAERLAL